MNNPVNWFEIYVQDMARARRFYETVLGVKLEPLPNPGADMPGLEMWAFPMQQEPAPGAAGSLVFMPGMPSGGNSTLVYFSCQDVATESARVASAGGRIQQPKMSIGPYGYIAVAVDTEGNAFGLHSMQ
jgi:predicted enzyme related to lactoylglutathione lyase